jgi:hypothetical protein
VNSFSVLPHTSFYFLQRKRGGGGHWRDRNRILYDVQTRFPIGIGISERCYSSYLIIVGAKRIGAPMFGIPSQDKRTTQVSTTTRSTTTLLIMIWKQASGTTTATTTTTTTNHTKQRQKFNTTITRQPPRNGDVCVTATIQAS